MDIKKGMYLMDKYAICPKCGFVKIVDENDIDVEVGDCNVCKVTTLKSNMVECVVCGKDFCNYCNRDVSNSNVCSICTEGYF